MNSTIIILLVRCAYFVGMSGLLAGGALSITFLYQLLPRTLDKQKIEAIKFCIVVQAVVCTSAAWALVGGVIELWPG